MAQSELELFRDSLKAGDDKAAKTHLRAGEDALGDAVGAAQSGQVRLAKGLPYVGPTIEDLDHLLAAATIMTDSARDAMDVYENFSGEDSKLFDDGKFSIPRDQAGPALGQGHRGVAGRRRGRAGAGEGRRLQGRRRRGQAEVRD